MKPRRVQVSHQKDEGFTLTVEEYSRFRSGVAWVADKLCVLTGHHFCNSGPIAWAFEWDWHGSTELVRIPIERETADKLAYDKDSWSWLDESDE